MAVPNKKANTDKTSPNVATMPPSSNTDPDKAPSKPALFWGPLGPGVENISARNRALIRLMKSAGSLSALVTALQSDPAFSGASNLVKAGNVSNHIRRVRKAMKGDSLGHLVPTFGKSKGTVDTKALADLFAAETA